MSAAFQILSTCFWSRFKYDSVKFVSVSCTPCKEDCNTTHVHSAKWGSESLVGPSPTRPVDLASTSPSLLQQGTNKNDTVGVDFKSGTSSKVAVRRDSVMISTCDVGPLQEIDVSSGEFADPSQAIANIDAETHAANITLANATSEGTIAMNTLVTQIQNMTTDSEIVAS